MSRMPTRRRSPADILARRAARPALMARRKAEFLAALVTAKSGPCSDCSLRFPPVCMDFDHRDPSSKGPGPRGNRERGVKRGAAGVEEILRNCDLVCARCHRLRTDVRDDYLVKQPDRPRTSKMTPRQQEKRRKKRQAVRDLIQSLKAGRPCADCKGEFPAVCMDFDHSGEKVMNVSAMAVRVKSLARVRDEAAKCEVVCACCHRLRTEGRRLCHLRTTSRTLDSPGISA